MHIGDVALIKGYSHHVIPNQIDRIKKVRQGALCKSWPNPGMQHTEKGLFARNGHVVQNHLAGWQAAQWDLE